MGNKIGETKLKLIRFLSLFLVSYFVFLIVFLFLEHKIIPLTLGISIIEPICTVDGVGNLFCDTFYSSSTEESGPIVYETSTPTTSLQYIQATSVEELIKKSVEEEGISEVYPPRMSDADLYVDWGESVSHIELVPMEDR